MSLQITYFVHGTTTDNEQGKATGWNPGVLSELGIRQSKELASLVHKEDFAAVFCSDLQRAVDSTKLAFGDGYHQDARLREINYGDFNGHAESFKDDLIQFIEKRFPNGENYNDVEHRLRSFVDEIKKKYDGKRIAIVAHQAPQLALEVIVNGKSWEQAIASDWRKVGSWQPGWEYFLP